MPVQNASDAALTSSRLMLPTSSTRYFVRPAPSAPPRTRAAADEAEDTLGLAGVVDVVGERPELADEQNAEDLTEQIQPRRCRFRAGLEQRPEDDLQDDDAAQRHRHHGAAWQAPDRVRVLMHQHADQQSRRQHHPRKVVGAEAGDEPRSGDGLEDVVGRHGQEGVGEHQRHAPTFARAQDDQLVEHPPSELGHELWTLPRSVEPVQELGFLLSFPGQPTSNEASMKRLGLLLALCGVVALIERPSAMIPEQVKIDTGLLSGTAGTTQPTVRTFKGIPFAAPPLGENRWKAPQPAAKWDGVRKADAFGAPCAAGAPPAGRGGRGPGAPGAAAANPGQVTAAVVVPPREPARAEDCLYANVWTSAASANDKRPVMVWIYGGGFTGGSGGLTWYDGENLAAKGPVIVTVQLPPRLARLLRTP
jgi:hypothetical protein